MGKYIQLIIFYIFLIIFFSPNNGTHKWNFLHPENPTGQAEFCNNKFSNAAM